MSKSTVTFDQLLQNTGVTTNAQTTAELLGKFGLDWKVSKQALILPSGKPSGFFGVVREDTEHTFATCKAGYEVFQNSELLDLVNDAAGRVGLAITKGGSFNKGGRVYVQLDSGLVTGLGKNKDTVQKNISAINSHDGSTSTRWGATNVTISCSNTFWSAYREMKNSVKHTSTMRDRIDQMVREIELVQKFEEDLYKKFFQFAEVGVTKKHIETAVKLTLDIDITKQKNSDLTKYQENRLGDLSTAIQGEMKQKGETLWGLFSGVTKYTTHLMPGGDINRAQSKAMGSGYAVDNAVFEAFAEVLN